jgi:hypothetical protein
MTAAECQWSPGQACQFSTYTSALIEYKGRTYCPLHLPLGGKAHNGPTFASEFRDLQEKGYGDFSGVSFAGELDKAAPPQRYDVVRSLILRGCTFGDHVEVVVHNVPCDLSRSTFLGASKIHVPGDLWDFLCEDARFNGYLFFEASGCTGRVTVARSDFDDGSRFNWVDGVRALNSAGCTFAKAPTFGATPKLPARTEFKGATFKLHAEDESAFRVIRNFFNDHRARDLEGRFYAYEKRCHRLGLRRPREWVPRALSFLYDATSEYGYSYGRALVWFCIVQLAFGVAYAALSDRLVPGGDFDSRVVAFTFAQVVKPFELFGSKGATDGAYAIVPAIGHGWWLLLTAVQSILSISLLALFLLALRWRSRRE